VREFFFALNKNTTTTRDNDPLTPLFLFFLLRESSRIFLLTQPQGLTKTNFIGRKQKRPLQRKTQKIQKNTKILLLARDISRTIIIIIIIIIIKRSSSRSEEKGRERERNLSSLFR